MGSSLFEEMYNYNVELVQSETTSSNATRQQGRLANSFNESPNWWIFSPDCLYLDGSSYTGNMFATASGIQCQSWTEQCPHRHTMNDTYPELNLAQNFCRNPQSSGKRPWCFTTDRNKRWEYCDIPNCIKGMYLASFQ